MNAIILAAGKGMRLNEGKANAKPKCMEVVNGISIIKYQITACQKVGIENFTIVVGYQKDMLKKHVLEFLPEKYVSFIENDKYETTNTLGSLWAAKMFCYESFVYFNADVLFHKDLLSMLLKEQGKCMLLVEKKEVGEEEVKVRVSQYGFIHEIGKHIPPAEAQGEFIGIGVFNDRYCREFVRALEQGINEGQENNYFEWSVNLICEQIRLQAVYTDGLPCIEIDFPEDLEKAKLLFPALKDAFNPPREKYF